MQKQRFYYLADMAGLLGKSVLAIYGHIVRKQYDAVPPPMRLGRHLVWLAEAVDEWINIKVACAKLELEKQMKELQAAPRRRGRPTKAEARKKKKEEEILKILSSKSSEDGNCTKERNCTKSE
jgi:predicted DNA-binding transcriptional regulator AlpA